MKHNRPRGAARNRVRLGAGGIRVISAAALAVAACALWTIPASAAIAGPAAHAAKKVPTKTTASAKPSTVDVNVSTTLSATVKASSGKAPSGTVTFTNTKSGKKLCSASLSGGKAHCSGKVSSTGSFKLKAAYGGNSTHATSSATFTVKAVKAATTTTVTTSPASAATGTPVTLSAKVTGGATPAGKVTFKDGAGTLCTATLSSGKASCAHTFGGAATYKITGRYAGNAAHLASSDSTTVTVTKTATTGIATTTTITDIDPGSVQAGSQSVISVAVTAATGTPAGTVDVTPVGVTDPAASLSCTATLTDGAGTCTVTTPTAGYGAIDYQASYAGNATYAGSKSADPGSTALTVMQTTTTILTSGTATAGTPVTLTATVTAAADNNISASGGGTGTVTFSIGGTPISSACTAVGMTYDAATTSNVAACSYTFTAGGSYTVTATYSGDPYNDTSTGTDKITVTGH